MPCREAWQGKAAVMLSPMGQGSGARQGDHSLQEVTVQAVPQDTSQGRSTSGRFMPLHLMTAGETLGATERRKSKYEDLIKRVESLMKNE